MLRWIADMFREAMKTPIEHEKARAESLASEIQKTLSKFSEKQILADVSGTFPDHALDLEASEKFDEMWLVRMTSTAGLSMVVVIFGGLAPGRKLTQQEIASIGRTMKSNWLVAVYTMHVSQIGISWDC